MAELVIALETPHVHEEAGTRRAAARARVRYVPASGGRGIDGAAADFVAPFGPIEAGELRWYLEAYGIWPFGRFKERAEGFEASLPGWGRKLFDAVLGRAEGRPAFDAWRNAAGVERRVTVFVDDGDCGHAARSSRATRLGRLPLRCGNRFGLGAQARETAPFGSSRAQRGEALREDAAACRVSRGSAKTRAEQRRGEDSPGAGPEVDVGRVPGTGGERGARRRTEARSSNSVSASARSTGRAWRSSSDR